MFNTRNNTVIGLGLLCATFLWGGNNTGIKFLVSHWPPVWTACTRMLCVGGILLAALRWTRWLGPSTPLTPSLRFHLWWRGGLSLAVYVAVFTWSLKFTSASHVALYLGAAPIWALLWEGGPHVNRDWVRRYGAAILALIGLLILFWPKLQPGSGDWRGDLLALAASVLWTVYGRNCRAAGASLSGFETTACTMWRAAVWLLPIALWEMRPGIVWQWSLAGAQLYCIVFGGIIAFALYNNALRHWPVSDVFLFGNLIPATTMGWAWLLLDEPMTKTFWVAMLFVAGGVVLGQWRSARATPEQCPLAGD